jgi:hypothetical protein
VNTYRQTNTDLSGRIAYLLLVHTDPEQCLRLCTTLLLDPKADIYIHVDLKAKQRFCLPAHSSGRVYFIEERYPVYWSGFNMVLATLALMKAARSTNIAYQHLVLLSGLCYPLKHPTAIRHYLRDSETRQHINRINAFDSKEYYIHQVTRYHFRDAFLPFPRTDKIVRKIATILARPIRRQLPSGLIPCEGSSWWALTGDCAMHLLEMARERTDLYWLYKYTMAADEHFFHTLVQNSPFAAQAAPIMTYTGKGMWKRANLHVIHPSLKKTYTIEDFNTLLATDKLFVRKVTTAKSDELVNKLDSTFVNPPCVDQKRARMLQENNE